MKPIKLVVKEIEEFSSKEQLVHFESGESIYIGGWVKADKNGELRFLSWIDDIEKNSDGAIEAEHLKVQLYRRFKVPIEKFDDPEILLKARSVVAGAILDYCKDIEDTVYTIGFYDYDPKNELDENGVLLRLSTDAEVDDQGEDSYCPEYSHAFINWIVQNGPKPGDAMSRRMQEGTKRLESIPGWVWVSSCENNPETDDSEEYNQLAEESSETDINDLILEVQQLLAEKMREFGMVENAQDVTDSKSRCDDHVDVVKVDLTTSGSSEGVGKKPAESSAKQVNVANVL